MMTSPLEWIYLLSYVKRKPSVIWTYPLFCWVYVWYYLDKSIISLCFLVISVISIPLHMVVSNGLNRRWRHKIKDKSVSISQVIESERKQIPKVFFIVSIFFIYILSIIGLFYLAKSSSEYARFILIAILGIVGLIFLFGFYFMREKEEK